MPFIVKWWNLFEQWICRQWRHINVYQSITSVTLRFLKNLFESVNSLKAVSLPTILSQHVRCWLYDPYVIPWTVGGWRHICYESFDIAQESFLLGEFVDEVLLVIEVQVYSLTTGFVYKRQKLNITFAIIEYFVS